MTTPAEQEAERRYERPPKQRIVHVSGTMQEGPFPDRRAEERRAFVAGAEWALEQYRELLEAAREYREADAALNMCLTTDQDYPRLYFNRAAALDALTAAAAALPGGS